MTPFNVSEYSGCLHRRLRTIGYVCENTLNVCHESIDNGRRIVHNNDGLGDYDFSFSHAKTNDNV